MNKSIWAVIGSMILVVCMLIVLPVLTAAADTATIAELMQQLTNFGYIAYAAAGPGDWTVTGDILPSVNNTQDIGAAGTRFQSIYAGTSVITPLITATTGNITTVNATTVGATTLNAPTGRTATYVVAASDAPSNVKAQADITLTADNQLTTAIEAAITAGAYNIRLSQGTFNESAVCDITTSNVDLSGSGWSTVINYSGQDYFLNINNCDGVTIHDLKVIIAAGAGVVNHRPDCINLNVNNNSEYYNLWLEGDLTVVDTLPQQMMTGIYADTTNGNIYRDNIIVNHKRTSICLVRTYYDQIINNYCAGNGQYGLDLYDVTAGGTFTSAIGNTIKDVGVDGILIRGHIYTIADNTIINPTGAGIYFSTGTNDAVITGNNIYSPGSTGIITSNANLRALIEGNKIYDTTQYGMYLRGTSHALISDNHIYTCVRSGILMETTCSNNDIKGNTIKNIDTGNAGYYGIDVNSGSSNNISLNTITDSAGLFGIIIRAGNTGNIVTDNDLQRNDAPLSNLGTATIILRNQGYISPSELRTASGSVTGGAANAILFSWHNPEAQDIFIKKVIVNITTADADAANIDIGIADDATYTNGGTEFFNDMAGETIAVDDSFVVGDGGAQTKWVLCQDSASATDGWVTAKILDADGTSIVGSYYIVYVGK